MFTYVDRDHRRCKRCWRVLLLAAFPPASNYDGLDSHCRDCKRELNRLWREQHPELVAAYNERRRIPPTKLTCVECGSEFEGRKDPNRLLAEVQGREVSPAAPGGVPGEAAAEGRAASRSSSGVTQRPSLSTA